MMELALHVEDRQIIVNLIDTRLTMTYQLSPEGQLEENEFWTVDARDAEFRQRARRAAFSNPQCSSKRAKHIVRGGASNSPASQVPVSQTRAPVLKVRVSSWDFDEAPLRGRPETLPHGLCCLSCSRKAPGLTSLQSS